MKNLDLNNTGNLDESFSNANGKIKAWFSDKKNIRNTLLLGPAAALIASRNRKKKAELALLEANRQLEEAKSSGKSGDNSNGDSNSGNNPSEERTGMNPAVKWSLIGGGILVVLVGGFFAIRYFKNK